MMDGETTEISIQNGEVSVNSARVVKADNAASNGCVASRTTPRARAHDRGSNTRLTLALHCQCGAHHQPAAAHPEKDVDGAQSPLRDGRFKRYKKSKRFEGLGESGDDQK